MPDCLAGFPMLTRALVAGVAGPQSLSGQPELVGLDWVRSVAEPERGAEIGSAMPARYGRLRHTDLNAHLWLPDELPPALIGLSFAKKFPYKASVTQGVSDGL